MAKAILILLGLILVNSVYADESCDYVLDPEGNYIISCPNFFDNPSYYDNNNHQNNKKNSYFF